MGKESLDISGRDGCDGYRVQHISNDNISRTNVARLLIDADVPKHNETIHVYQYLRSLEFGNSANGALNISTGFVDSVNETIFNYYLMATCGSPGSPILNAFNKVIGLELQAGDTINKWKGIRMNSICEAYKNELQRNYGSLTENDMWLGRISDIQQIDFKLIGCGGYGKVYKIVESNGNILALKLVEGFGGLDSFQSQINAMKKEYQLVTSLQLHPRIIQFFAFVQDDFKARLMIIMEYLEGGSLFDKINSKGSLDKINSLRYLEQILEAVDFLHIRSVYHSDIKPANILFTSSDDIKLCDFGIAVHLHTESSVSIQRRCRLYVTGET